MPSLLLNIGLNIGDVQALTVSDVVQAIERQDHTIQALRVVRSDTELTAVVQIASDAEHGISLVQSQDIGRLSSYLGQDCIAIYAPSTCAGMLVGPKALEWGPFNADFFFDLNGRRVSEGFVQLAA